MASERTAYFEGLEYQVQLRRENGRFYLYIRELNLIADNEDLSAAYADLDQRKKELFEKHVFLGKESEIPLPAEMSERSHLKKALTPFLIKAAVVALVGAILVGTAHVSILYALQEAPRSMALKAGRSAIKRFVSGLEDFAEKEISPEREARLRGAIRAVVPKLQPYAEELRPLFVSAAVTSGDACP